MAGKHFDLDTRIDLGGEGASDITIASQKAVKTYVDNKVTSSTDVNDKTITINVNNSEAGSFTTNTATSQSINITVPTKTSDLTNDSGFIIEHQSLSEYAKLSEISPVPSEISAFINDVGYLSEADLPSMMTYKGTKASESDLPSSNNKIGDVWNVTQDGSNYAWDGTQWDCLGGVVDLVGYQKTITAVTHESNTVVGSVNKPVYIDASGAATEIDYTIAKSVPSDAQFTDTTYTAGTGLSLSGTIINHSNNITAGTAGTSNATSGSTLSIPYVTYDAQGHITSIGDRTHTITGFLTNQDLSEYQRVETAVTHESNTAVGDAITPVYIDSTGAATALDFTIAKSVPSDAAFTDTTYTAGEGIHISDNNVITSTGNISYTNTCPALTPSNGYCTWTITHNLGTQNIIAILYYGNIEVGKNTTIISDNQISVSFPSSSNVEEGSYRIVIVSCGGVISGGGGGDASSDDLFYKSGDVFNVYNDTICPGYISNGNKTILFSINSNKFLSKVSTISVNSLYVNIRSNSGTYLVDSNYRAGGFNLKSHEYNMQYPIEAIKSTDTSIIIAAVFKGALGGATNNAPLTVTVSSCNITFS